ncbi:hypothetical protein GC194_10520 [bacterium]|nr:hypothetical protein [bacterium]
MSKNLIVFSLLTIFLLVSCEETLYKEPQPGGVKEQKSFPEKIRGTYITGDGDTIVIEEKQVVELKKTMISKNSPYVLGDSIKLKKYKHYLFVSYLADNNYWSTILIDYKQKGYLHLYQIDPKSTKIKALKNITKVEEFKDESGKTDFLLLNPSKREWKKIIKEEIPQIIETYRKVGD